MSASTFTQPIEYIFATTEFSHVDPDDYDPMPKEQWAVPAYDCSVCRNIDADAAEGHTPVGEDKHHWDIHLAMAGEQREFVRDALYNITLTWLLSD